MGSDENGLVILDCTIRDGNYAVEFKFTKADTGLLTGLLARLGFEWIEVGHGFGLGAMEAGKGDMPASDVDLLRAAKATCCGAKIGMFYIPGIGRMDQLEAARDVGLDFIRIGDNAPEVEKAYPHITRARELGLIPCLNMMKTYAVSPHEFAMKAKGAIEAGAEIVYCVDSAGSMLPEDVARYFDATRELVNCKLGFHGHNNLMMAIANCIAAYRHGARYLDATLCGFGRSAGNAPTEILVAVCERLGIPTRLDLFEIMDAVEMYMWPLVAQTRPHDMMAVVGGYSQFHSSFLRKVADAARQHRAELRRLVARVALHDPVTVQDDFLQAAARELANTSRDRSSDALLSFSVPGLSRERIGNSLQSVEALIEGLVVSSAKRAGTRTVLHLVPSEEPADDLLLPEFVLADSHMVMGRVIYGSLALLRQVLEIASPDVFMFLTGQQEGWASEAAQVAAQVAGVERVVPVRDKELRRLFLLEVLDRAGQRHGNDALLVYGADALILQALQTGTGFKSVFLYGPEGAAQPRGTRSVVLKGWDDWRDLRLQFNVVLVGADPPEADARVLLQALAPDGRLLSILPMPDRDLRAAGERLAQIDLNVAYCGIVARYLEAERATGAPR